MEWTQENTVRLIETYRLHEILWNPKHPRYYNKIQKNDAWNDIASELNGTTEECKKKMTALLSALRREKTKIKKSRGTGTGRDEVYESSWFAFKSLLFLWDKDSVRKSKSTISDEEISEEDEADESANTVEVLSNESAASQRSDVAQEGYLPSTQDEAISTQKAHSANIVSPRLPPKKKKRSIQDARLDEAFRVLSNASTQGNQNESQIFGNLVSTKLQKYSADVQTAVQQDIMNILFRADRGYYSRPSPDLLVSPQSYSQSSHIPPQPYITCVQNQSSTSKPNESHYSIPHSYQVNQQPPVYHQLTRSHPSQYTQLSSPSPQYTPSQSPSLIESNHSNASSSNFPPESPFAELQGSLLDMPDTNNQ